MGTQEQPKSNHQPDDILRNTDLPKSERMRQAVEAFEREALKSVDEFCAAPRGHNLIATTSIERDHSRYRQIVRGKIRENLKRYVNHGEMIGKKGKDLVTIPVPSIDTPRFRFGKNGSGGVGSGDGEEGDSLGKGKGKDGAGKAGENPGEHTLEEMSVDELAGILGDELKLPRLKPKDKAQIDQLRKRYNSIRSTGPESLKHHKRTFKEAMKRQISAGEYNPDDPKIIPIQDDKKYRDAKPVPNPQVNAAIILMMDVSGSMTDEQKKIVRAQANWIQIWVQKHYPNVSLAFVIHDAAAREVDEETFYHTRESGGTRISTGYEVVADIIQNKYPPHLWNLYFFQFSDGDNWGEDNQKAMKLLKERIIPFCNLTGYSQVHSPYGSGEFLGTIQKEFAKGKFSETLRTTSVKDREGIYGSLKDLLG